MQTHQTVRTVADHLEDALHSARTALQLGDESSKTAALEDINKALQIAEQDKTPIIAS